MLIRIDEERVRVAFGKMLLLKEAMNADTEFDTAGAGENYKQGFIDGVDGCIKLMQDSVTLESK